MLLCCPLTGAFVLEVIYVVLIFYTRGKSGQQENEIYDPFLASQPGFDAP